MFHLNFMSNLLNFCYIVCNEESQKASAGSRSSLPSSYNFFFFFWIELSLATLFT